MLFVGLLKIKRVEGLLGGAIAVLGGCGCRQLPLVLVVHDGEDPGSWLPSHHSMALFSLRLQVHVPPAVSQPRPAGLSPARPRAALS